MRNTLNKFASRLRLKTALRFSASSNDGTDSPVQLFSCHQKPLRGFYMLEVEVAEFTSASRVYLGAKEAGFNGTELSFPLRITRSGMTKRICYFDRAVQQFTWHCDTKILCGVGHVSIRLTKLARHFALKRMARKLTVKHGRPITLAGLGYADFIASYNELFTQQQVASHCQQQSYQQWIEYVEPGLWSAEHQCLASVSNNAQYNAQYSVLQHKFSIVVPTYNAKPEWLDSCFESVLKQTYGNWQLVIVDDASTDKLSLQALATWVNRDARICIIKEPFNGHISQATNTGIAHCDGEFICFLDHDDLLAPQALNELVLAINQTPNVKLLYSDEDLMTEEGVRVTPHFKSSWNPELLLSHNYITHLCCYQRKFVNQLGGMRSRVDGAQDYDLLLRASLELNLHNNHDQIVHIPKVLYHWRMVEGSTATSATAKSYTAKAGLTALEDHLKVVCPSAKVSHCLRDHYYRVNWPLPAVEPSVTIIIPTRDGVELLRDCIKSIFTITAYNNFDIVIVDNGSKEADTLRYLTELAVHPKVRILEDNSPFNYSRLNNLAVRCDRRKEDSKGDLVCLLNNDTLIIHPEWLTEMVQLAIRPEVGCVGAKLLYPDDTIQHAGVILGLGGYAAHSHRGLGRNSPGYFGRAQVRQNLSAVTGACLMVRREVYLEVGGLTESYTVAYNDVDFCLKVMKAGYRNIYTPYAELYHLESKTRGDDNSAAKQARFNSEKAQLMGSWREWIVKDPYYSPNLTRDREDFSIATFSSTTRESALSEKAS
jgi:GT2 family glycosyltransferase